MEKKFPEVKHLCAKVKPGNGASGGIFRKLGYEERTEAEIIVYQKDLQAVSREN